MTKKSPRRDPGQDEHADPARSGHGDTQLLVQCRPLVHRERSEEMPANAAVLGALGDLSAMSQPPLIRRSSASVGAVRAVHVQPSSMAIRVSGPSVCPQRPASVTNTARFDAWRAGVERCHPSWAARLVCLGTKTDT